MIVEGTVMKNMTTGGVVNEVEIPTTKRKEKAEVEEAQVFKLLLKPPLESQKWERNIETELRPN